jgi:uncharacterized protein YoaH (UPF0181 family)
VGNHFRAASDTLAKGEAGRLATDAFDAHHSQGLEATLLDFVDRVGRAQQGGGRSDGGSHGGGLWDRAHGRDDSPLEPDRAARSYSAEHTFPYDTVDRRQLWHELQSQASELAARLQAEGLQAGEVAIKLRYASFETLTRQTRLTLPTASGDQIALAAASLMRRHWDRSRAVRLIGVRAARLMSVLRPIQLPLPLPHPYPGRVRAP